MFKKLLFFSALAIIAFAAPAKAETPQINAAVEENDFSHIETLLRGNEVDPVIKALLKSVETTMMSHPETAEKKITLAAQYAPEISAPSVPAICADLRRIAEAMEPNQLGSSFYDAVLSATQSFSSAPVVVAAGRPNLCEEAWLQIATLTGDPLLAQGHYRPVPPPGPPPEPPVPVSRD